MSSGKEKGKRAFRKARDVSAGDPSDGGDSIDTLSEVEVKMRLEAMDTFGKWWAGIDSGIDIIDDVVYNIYGIW